MSCAISGHIMANIQIDQPIKEASLHIILMYFPETIYSRLPLEARHMLLPHVIYSHPRRNSMNCYVI